MLFYQIRNAVLGALIVLTLAAVLSYLGLRAGLPLWGSVTFRGEQVAPGKNGVRSVLARAEAWAKAPVAVLAGPYVARIARKELGALLAIEAPSARLLKLGRGGNPLLELDALLQSYRGGIELSAGVTIARGTLSDRIQTLRSTFERAPVPGTVTPDGKLLGGLPGVSINSVTAVELVERALRADALQVALQTHLIPAPAMVAYAAADAREFPLTMVEAETRFRSGGASAGRAQNIEAAVAAIDGFVMPPGGQLSFNAVVGERSYERGFAAATEIANKRIVLGVGGGVCQVAATLHAAAFLGGFDLPVYRPHSRPARYITLGLDTMVSWPAQDMVIANPYPFAVRVRATADRGLLRIALDGTGKAHPVEWNTQVLERVKPGVQRIEDPSLPAGESDVLQEAIDGLLVRRTRTIYFPTGPRTENSTLRYPPNDRILAVGPPGARGSAIAETAEARKAVRIAAEDF